jgi:hypothetical protein
MGYSVKYIAQYFNEETGEIIKEDLLKIKPITFPKTLNEFGLRQTEQVELIKKSQDFMLQFQCVLLSHETLCPKCGKKLRKQGLF